MSYLVDFGFQPVFQHFSRSKMNTDDLNFDTLIPVEVEFKYKGKQYVLKEASEDAACRWRNALLKATKLGPEGKPVSIEGLADSEPLLVSCCVFERMGTEDKPVHQNTIRGWPSRMIKRLFKKVQEISDLDEGPDKEALEKRIKDDTARLASLNNGEDSAKNSPSASMATSDSPTS